MATKYTGRLKNKRVLVLGGSSGIGFCVAEAAVEHGAIVIISSSQQAKVSHAIERILASYPDAKDRVSGKPCDLADAADAEANLLAVLDFATNKQQDKLDHIAMTAGNSWAVPAFSELEGGHLQTAQQVRVVGGMYVGKHARAFMHSATPASSITLTSGAAVFKPRANFVAQTTQAASLQGLTRSLAVELAPLRVNLVAPGAVDTEFWARLPPEFVEEAKADFKTRMLLPDWGDPEDVAEAYLYFMKDKFVTGETLVTDGGFLLV